MISCKNCGKKFRTVEMVAFHLIFVEKIKVTKKDVVFVIRNCILAKVLRTVFVGILSLLWLITVPLSLANQKLEDIINYFHF